MSLVDVRNLLGDGRYADAEKQALVATEQARGPEERAEALLLAAEAAAKQGDADAAERHLTRAMQAAPEGSEALHRAVLNLGKVYLRRNEFSLAEQVYLEALARHRGNAVMISRAQFGLGQVYEAQHRWDVAADMYRLAATGYAQAERWAHVIGARQNEAWTLMMDARADDARVVLGIAEQYLAYATELQRHNQRALLAYAAYQMGNTETAANLAAELITNGGPSAWANCVAAITAGWIAHHSGMAAEAQKALALADGVMWAASHETGSTDLINLVNELRSRAA